MARMNRPAPVEITYKNMRFLITHNPTNATLNKFVEVSQIVVNCLHIILQSVYYLKPTLEKHVTGDYMLRNVLETTTV